MSSNATKKKAHVGAIPSIVGKWTLTVCDSPQLLVLQSIDISFQEEDETSTRIFGSVRTSPPDETNYAIENGEIAINPEKIEVTFNVTMTGILYSFKGEVEELKITKGSITWSPVNSPTSRKTTDGGMTEDGSWSAQAQAGPGEEKKQPPPKPVRRTRR